MTLGILEKLEKETNGDAEAVKRFTDNHALVYHIAKNFRHLGHLSCDENDFINEGLVGLWCAAQLYDPSKGVKFSTYAVHWIKQKIRLAATRMTLVMCIPRHGLHRSFQVKQFTENYYLRQGEMPPQHLTMRKLKTSKKFLRDIIQFRHAVTSSVRLDGVIRCGNAHDVIRAGEDRGEKDAQIFEQRLEIVLKVVQTLEVNQRDKEIFLRRTGIDGKPPETLEIVGSRLKLTRERVRQIELKIFKIVKQRVLNAAEKESLNDL